MYYSILSNIALWRQNSVLFPLFLLFFEAATFGLVCLQTSTLLISPHSGGGGTYFCADPVSDGVSINSVPLPQLPFLCECMISYEPIGVCLGISLG